MDEAHFSRNLRAAFRNYGAKVQNFEDKYSLGVPDMVVIYKGKTYWLELKVFTIPKRTNTHLKMKFQPHQVPWMLSAKAAGANVLVFAREKETGLCYFLPPQEGTYSQQQLNDVQTGNMQLQVRYLLRGDYDGV